MRCLTYVACLSVAGTSLGRASEFVSNFENCDIRSEALVWDGAEAASPDRLSITHSPVRSGKCALSILLKPNDGAGGKQKRNRVELKELIDARDGAVSRFSFSLFVPTDYPDTPRCGVLVAQWKSKGADGPTISLTLGKKGDEIGFHMTSGVKGVNVGPVATFFAEASAWNDFLVSVMWSANRDGLVQIFHNDQEMGEKRGPNRSGSKPYQFRIGQYAGKCRVLNESILYVDDVRIE